MDASSLTNALLSQGIQAFGLAVPQLAPDWVANASAGAGTAPFSVTDSIEPMALTLTSGNWAAPCTAAITVIDPTKGQTLPITLLKSDGTAHGAAPAAGGTGQGGVLLTLFEAAWLRLGWLYATLLETGTTRPERASGLPCRQVPRYFFYPGATHSQTTGIAEASADLAITSGDLWIHDNDGLPIDPIAILAAFNALMQNAPALLAGGASTKSALGGYVTALLSTADIRIRVVDPAGAPAAPGTLLPALTAITDGPPVAVGLYTVPAGTPVALQAVSTDFTQDQANRIVFGPVTSDRLTNSFTPPALPTTTPKIALQRDFYTMRLVDLTTYLLGAPNSLDPATQTQPAIDVRINENVTLLGTGNDVLGAVGQALASPADPTLAVAQALDGGFTLPASPGAASAWPTFPVGVASPDPITALPLTWPELKITAGFVGTQANDASKVDVCVTIAGFPVGPGATPDTTNAWARLYTRRFGIDAVQQRGDGRGGPIPASGTLSLTLTDPLGLLAPGQQPTTITAPQSATLQFDMAVVLPNQTARIYGGLSAPIAAAPTTPPAVAPVTNRLSNASVQGVSNAGILGLGKPLTASFPSSPAGWAALLSGVGTLRDAPRLPTMARRELLAAGSAAGSWTGVIGGGRLTPEAICALPRLGEPGGSGGRETIITGASTSGGRLAYDIARHALRRGQDIYTRIATLAGSAWTLPKEPPALAAGSLPNATSGTFAGALLQTIAPSCETPELSPVLGSPSRQNFIALLTTGSSSLPGSLGSQLTGNTDVINALNSLAATPPSPLAPFTDAALQIAEELLRELSSSALGRRDAQWALGSALGTARHFVYIETPGFCSTMDNTKPPPVPPDTFPLDLIAVLAQRLGALPGLRVMICVPKYPDFAKGYETLAAYEAQDRYNILIGTPQAASQLPTPPTVAFHPIGFPGRSSRIESHVVIVDDCWALIGGSSFRRRGLSFDGSSDLVLTDIQLVDGRSAGIRDFRRALMAQRLGIPANAEHPSYVQLYDGRRSFDLVRSTLQNGGLGKVDLMWNGVTPGVTAPTAAPIAQANPDGRSFDETTANIVAAFAASTSGV